MPAGDLIIHINGWPGCGKLTIAREMAALLGARLLDNHTMLNPSEALFDRRDPLHHSLRKAVRAPILDHVARMKPGTALILTDALSDEPIGRALFDDYRVLAERRGASLLSVVLDCTPDRNAERLVSPGRAENRKLTNPRILATLRDNEILLRPAGVPLIELDISDLSAPEAAHNLVERCRAALESDPQTTEPSP